MTTRRKALSATALCVLVAGGGVAWTLTPSKVEAVTPVVMQPARPDPWTKGPVDRDYMVQGILDYRSDQARR